jgi:hypothetical protein
MTVEFWFKLSRQESYRAKSHIFSLDSEDKTNTFEISILPDNKGLLCAPLGQVKTKQVVATTSVTFN